MAMAARRHDVLLLASDVEEDDMSERDALSASSGEAERLATALEQKAEEAPGATRRGVMREAAALLRQQAATANRVRELVESWRQEAAVKAAFHATMGIGWHACADDLAAALRGAEE